MTPQQFIAKWKRANLSERSAAQQHFLDLCDLLGQPKPAAADPDGAFYTFEKGVRKTDGGKGWADVWWKGRFGWEYKGKHKDLAEAYQQLQRYREDLENPPLLVVCDLDRFEIHTNFTNTVKELHAFSLDQLAEPKNLDILRKVFTNPEALKPKKTTNEITEEVAERFARLADGLRQRKIPARRAAPFLMKLMFCMFAEDIRLLPEKLFSKVLASSENDPTVLTRKLRRLFEAMAKGGDFGADVIEYFNGGLFAEPDSLELSRDEMHELVAANERDWSNVEPSIFGTLFERILDPDKRSQIGAHYTSKEDIQALLEPVMMAPLRREWEQVRQQCDDVWTRLQQAVRADAAPRTRKNLRGAFDKSIRDFLHRLDAVTVLDPACGSGNFLYVALHLLLDLEKEVISYGSQRGFTWFPHVNPGQLAGIEINPFAQQLAQVVIWIGYLQWMHHNGFKAPTDPILKPIENIREMDAILDLSDPRRPKEPEWPAAEFIVGNPPFLGGKLLRTHLGDDYVNAMFTVWDGRVPREADLCCYWFEKARRQIELGKCQRAGLLATQGIRGGANREVLKRILETGNIFFAASDRDWILDGANVHISMVGFDRGREKYRTLDGKPVRRINPNLTATVDVTGALPLRENLGIAFMGDTKGGPFDIREESALAMLDVPNPHGQPNSDVLVPWVNGLDITRRPRGMWIIDFGVRMKEAEAAFYERPFGRVRSYVKPIRDNNARESYRVLWWQHVEARPAMRAKLQPLHRFLATPTVAKHRLFVWMEAPTLPDHQLIVFARDDDYFFGVLQSRIHEVWGLKLGTRLETRPRYTPTTSFETFPFPNASQEEQAAIAAAAKELDDLRNRWLNPPEWTRTEVLEFPGSKDGAWARYVQNPELHGIGTVRYPRIVPKDDDCAGDLRQRTLTKLYNERPTWLDLAHQKLDAAVFAAYGWQVGMSDEEILAGLLALNLERAGT